jgi:Probable zinc-ribbon domain
MKSNKQRRTEIKAKRLERAERLAQIPKQSPLVKLSPGMVIADHAQLSHNNTYGFLPDLYADKPFVCRDCGAQEVWTAKQQKWWYEIAKGHIDSQAVRCRPCRVTERQRADDARRVSMTGLAKKQVEKDLRKK